jgi:hypothetical protein
VQRVNKVTAEYPARVTLDLVYRRPVAMISVAAGLFPVDEQGVLLSSADFTPAQARRYPRVVGIQSRPLGPVGTAWGDRDVTGAIQIAVALQAVWDDLGLESIRRTADQSAESKAAVSEFELATSSGVIIPWGRPPGSESPQEADVAGEVSRLKKYADQFGSLDPSAERGDLDLRAPSSERTVLREE